MGEEMDEVIIKKIPLKCDRCWRVTKDYKTMKDGDHLCYRCYCVLRDDFPEFLSCGVKEE